MYMGWTQSATFFWLICLILILLTSGQEIHGHGSPILQRIFNSYDPLIPPPNQDSLVTLLITEISSIHEIHMIWVGKMQFNQTWNDPRLSFIKGFAEDQITLDPNLMGVEYNLSRIPLEYIKRTNKPIIWIPTVKILLDSNLYNFNDLELPETRYTLDEYGMVLRSDVVTFVATCLMDLRRYPFDSQVCRLQIQGSPIHWGYHGARISSKAFLPGWTIVKQMYLKENYYSPRLVYSVGFKRDPTFAILTTFIPVMGAALISLCPLFMTTNKGAPCRTLLVAFGSVTGILFPGIVTWVNRPPSINYLRAMDAYIIGSAVLTFLSFLATLFVSTRRRLPKEVLVFSKFRVLAILTLGLGYTLFNLWFLSTYVIEHGSTHDGFLKFAPLCITEYGSMFYSAFNKGCDL